MSEDPFVDLPTAPAADPDLPGRSSWEPSRCPWPSPTSRRRAPFYEGLGFVVTGGDPEQDYLILKNGETTLGLFHGMFDQNILTFNPGLTNRMERLESFTDIREVQRRARGRRSRAHRTHRPRGHRAGVDHAR